MLAAGRAVFAPPMGNESWWSPARAPLSLKAGARSSQTGVCSLC